MNLFEKDIAETRFASQAGRLRHGFLRAFRLSVGESFCARAEPVL